MKKNIIINRTIALSMLLLSLISATVRAQDDEKSPLVVNLSYFTSNNNMQYVAVTAKSKISGKFQPVKGAEVKLYLDKDSSGKPMGFIGKVVTGEKGRAASNIPPALAQLWKSNVNHTFVAVTDKTKLYDATTTELAVAKARITIDTAEDKNLTATFSEYKGNIWVPVKGVDIKLCIKRLGGDLPISDKDSYTTDSTGKVSGEFKRDKLPGDKDGNLILVAKVEDNDTYGNLRVEKPIQWGAKFVAPNDFFSKSALWGSRFHSPIWLVFLAYSIVITVWGILLYLVILLVRIKKLGKQEEALK